MKKCKIIIAVILILAVSFFCGCTPKEEPKKPTETIQNTVISEEKPDSTDNKSAVKDKDAEKSTATNQEEAVPEIPDKPIEEVENQNIEIPEEKDEPIPTPEPVESENAVISDKELTCTLSVRCDTILGNMDKLESEKLDNVPKDGVIFAEKTVTFYEGESVFNVFMREMKQNKIHLEFENTPIYGSAYIEGIANIYEFDCGELSGWMYKVNDWYPNYGCSRYQLKAGDRIEWVYTCDLGKDVGGEYSARNGR